MARGEFVSFQLTLPNALGESGLVPQYAVGPKGKRPVLLSPSRLEAAAFYLDHPEIPISDPRNTPIKQHLIILRGYTFHRIAQATQMWQSVRPSDKQGYKAEYYRRLTSRVAGLAPTAKPAEIRSQAEILADSRMALPRLKSPNFETGERTVYQLIASAVIADMKTKPPFTETMTLPQIAAMATLSQELPFPDPAAVGAAWNNSDSSQELLQLTDRLYDYHQSLALLPVDYHSSQSRFTCYASELRVQTRLNDVNAVWNTRLDELTRGKSIRPPHTHVRVVDFKSGKLSFPPAESYSRTATRAGMMMTARLAAALPDHIPPTGKAVKVMVNPAGVNPDVEVAVDYVGMGGNQPERIRFGDYWRHDWSSPGKAREGTERFFDLLATIKANPNLEPFLR